MILMIDNYDSFVYNIYQYILDTTNESIKCVRNDEITIDEIKALNPSKIILSPGPKHPKDSGVCLDILRANLGIPILGICLGMQLLFDKDYEDGVYEGLGLISGEVRAIGEVIPKELKIPHIGWNALSIKKNSRLFKYINDGDYVYFVHSYHAVKCEDDTTSVTDYGAPLTASVEKGNVFGCQFHPEKSGEVGLSILKAFVEI